MSNKEFFESHKEPIRKLRDLMQANQFPALVFTYLLVLIIPVTMFGGLYGRVQQQVEAEILKSNTVMLEQVSANLDAQIRAAQRVVSEITVNPIIYRFLEGNKQLNTTKRLELAQVIGNLSALQTANSENLAQIYLYLPFYDMVATSGSVLSTPLYYKFAGSYDGMEYAQWLTLLDEDNDTERIIPLSQNGHNILAFIYKLPVTGQDCRAIIHLNVDSMLDTLDDIAGINGSNIYIVDRDGKEIITKTSDDSYPGSAEILADGAQTLGKKYFANVISSNVSNWKYLSIVSRNVLLSPMDYTRTYFLTLLIACLLIGVLIALRFASWNTKPVKDIVKLINTRVGHDENKPRNEFTYIENHFERLFSERQDFFDTLEQQKPLIQKAFFIELVKRKPDELQNLDILPTQFSHEGFIFVTFAVEGRDMTQNDLNDVFIAIYEEIKKSNFAGYVFEESLRTVLLVLNLPIGGKTACKEAILPILERIRLCFYVRGYQPVSVGVGGLKDNLGDLYLSRQESQQSLKQKVILGYGAMIFAGDIRAEREHKAEDHSFYSLDQEISLMNSIRSGDYEQAASIVDTIFDYALKRTDGFPEMALHFMIDFASTIIKVMDEMNLSRNELPELHHDPREWLMNSETMPALKQNSLHVLRHICSAVELGKKSHNTRLKERIIEYIEGNYMSDGISVQQICENINISPSYLSRFFKESMGENLKDYLLRARLKKAKELLGNTNHSIYEVANMVGYLNANTFIRAFKKQEGVTPGQYREQTRFAAGMQ